MEAPPPWPRFLPDLTLWHHWHVSRRTLPERWKGMGLPEICRALHVPHWHTVKPWRLELPGVGLRDTRGPKERVMTWETEKGALRSRWTLGPDGDWWRSEYPVKSPGDLPAALAVARAHRYVVKPLPKVPLSAGELRAVELPLRPWAELFNSFLGWSEGLMVFLEDPQGVQEIARALEQALAGLVQTLAVLPGRLVLSPDNLDGQFITAATFAENLAPSYQATADELHARGKLLMVHAGGPLRQLLPGLAGCGVDCLQGICGAPQGDTSLAEARALAAPGITLWGGIAQDFLLADRTQHEFDDAVNAAFADAAPDSHAVVGVADKVPAGALPERLEALAQMAAARFPA